MVKGGISTVNDILNNVRKSYLIATIRPLILVLLMLPITFVGLYSCVYEGFNIGPLLIVLICGAIAIFSIWKLSKIVSIIIDPRKCSVFKKYGSEEQISSILWEISSTKEYADKYIVISRNYIYNPKYIATLVACVDALGVHKYIHKTNGIVDGICLVITDKYGTEHYFDMVSEGKCDELIRYLMYKCPNAKFGYNNAEQAHIKQNTVPLQDVREKTWFCTDCGSEIKPGNKFCTKCGAKAYNKQ